MGTVGAGFSVSLDGFIAGPHDEVDRLFQWMFSGDTDLSVSIGEQDIDLKLPSDTAATYQEMMNTTGAIVSGRRIFDVAEAWGGKHPINVPVFVVTHHAPQEWVKDGSPFTFVTDGVASAIEQAKKVAGDKNIGVGGANVMQQCIKLGLLDEIHLDLVPVLLGRGIRMFDYLGIEPVELERTSMSAAPGVTQLTFRIIK